MSSPPPCMTASVPLAPLTTIGLGGPARWLARCGSADELRESLAFARREGLPLQVFSGGSNIIFADEGFDGVVLLVDVRGFRAEETSDTVVITAAAGEPWDGVVLQAVGKGWEGIECLSGIPGSAGATPVQNVGAYGQEVAETIVSLRALDRRTLVETEFSREECAFAYRRSRFKTTDPDRFIITEVTFRLYRNRVPEIRYPELAREIGAAGEGTTSGRISPAIVRDAVIRLRRRKSMVIDTADGNSRSVGSFFTNPVVQASFLEERLKGLPIPTFPAPDGVKLPAAWLVEHAGFPRGFQKRGAGISEHHALAIVNRGGTASDVLALAADIEERVFRTFGVRLEREPVVVRFRPGEGQKT